MSLVDFSELDTSVADEDHDGMIPEADTAATPNQLRNVDVFVASAFDADLLLAVDLLALSGVD